MMINKNDVITSMSQLNTELNKNHQGSLTSQFVNETLLKLQKSEGVAFTGSLQYFINKAPVIKLSENIKLNKQERALWRKVFSYNELGNNLWGARL
ncbi:hypothetical protein LCR01_09930 [Companilactobacillus crustorum]|uniref:Bacteriocin immunity protein n=3 Tax=Companilactobacillus TaxID=2767879 RepID=A0A837RK17_9LACO|nr:hypothetical protein [Companilactobacillus crustorum]APU70555.1 hypothetical protein BI355_0198 [Companilactobacillus crustorum]KRK43383.1 hypothetical protein FD26_GL002062 [Companilactobacillus crustorum JCM 15951]KRO20932.1 hypothetical protein IV63_GL002190 [Companilactobacillus crustorum]WDT65287.1 hypothetical protein NV391_10000 [Companilactobacillus crustorum]GEO76550.1 hypothetical protein LCR01_09930 [Companilactobacillus crustorum]